MPEYRTAGQQGGGGGRSPGGSSGGVPDGLLLGGLGLLLCSTLLVWLASGLSALLAHGSWPGGVSVGKSALAVRALLSRPGDPASIWPDTAAGELARPGLFWGVLIGLLMLLFTLAVVAMGAVTRYRLRRAERRAARRTAGGAVAADAPVDHEQVVAPQAPRQHPVPPAPQTAQAAPSAAGPDAPSATGPAVPDTAVQPTAGPLLAAPLLAGAAVAGAAPLPRDATPAEVLAEATGPALVVTADPALWSETVGARGKLGPTHLYDPTHAADAPVRLRWAPERGCQDMDTAASRAAALLAPVRSPAKADEAVHDTAVTLLRCALHAAAVDGRPFKQAHRWTTVAGSASDAVRILRTHKSAHSGAAGELEAVLIGYPERRDEATDLIRHAFDSLARLHVRNSCTAGRTDAVSLESFAAEGGTLYVLGESREDPRRDPGAMPLVTALTTHVVELGRRMAARSSSGRLDPPMTVVLDSPATVAPLPTLPALLAEGPTYGLHTHAHHRSPAQARTWWPDLRPSG